MQSRLSPLANFPRSRRIPSTKAPPTGIGYRAYRNRSIHTASTTAITLSLRRCVMPERETIERAHEDEREGKAPSTQAGEFVREEMHHIREGKHGAANTKQAIAIGLSKARRAGVKLKSPRKGSTSSETARKAESDIRKGQSNSRRKPSPTRSRATTAALKKEGHGAASHSALSRQARAASKKRSASSRHDSAVKAAQTRRKAS